MGRETQFVGFDWMLSRAGYTVAHGAGTRVHADRQTDTEIDVQLVTNTYSYPYKI